MIENPNGSTLSSTATRRMPGGAGNALSALLPLGLDDLGRGRTGGSGGKPLVLVIDPRPLMRETIAHWLEVHAPDFRILPLADPADAGRTGRDIGLAVLNIGGLLVTDQPVRQRLDLLDQMFPEVPVALLADRAGSFAVAEALRRGVRAYIPTALTPPAMVEALRLVYGGGTFVSTRGADVEDSPPRGCAAAEVEGFTPRQREVFGLLRQGKPNKIIAYELRMQQSTVKVHVRHIMMKLNATNRTQAVFLANRLIETGRAADARG